MTKSQKPLRRFTPLFNNLFIAIIFISFGTSCQVTKVGQDSTIETGTASWYGPGFHGKTTANGEKYDMNGLTAAHRTLAFGTKVKVINLDNGKSVTVRINDRGPYAKGRIIDLSKGAAKKVDMIEAGTAKVKLVLPANMDDSRITDIKKPHYTVQVGSFDTYDSAERRANEIQGVDVVKVKVDKKTLYRLYYGKYEEKTAAEKAKYKLNQEGVNGFVKQVEN